jgi:hypothetical protein
MSRNLFLIDRKISSKSWHGLDFFRNVVRTGLANRSDQLHLSTLKSYLSDSCSTNLPCSKVLHYGYLHPAHFFHHCRVSILTKPVRPVCRTGQTGMCVQKLNLAILSSFILVLDLFLFLRTYAWFVHLSSQEKQKSCLPED